jgi:hypothetical protein
MSIIEKGKTFYVKFRPFGTQIMLATRAKSRAEAKELEAALLTALRAADYRSLWPEAREAALRLFKNQQ